MNATASTPEQRAILKSRDLDLYLWRTSKTAPGVYTVAGEHGDYTVTVDRAGYHCTCTAGRNNRKCWHTASAYRLRLACRSLKPAAAASPAPVKPLSAGEQAKRDLWG